MAKKASYGNESISSLKGADRVRKRPAVIFGSDGIEGCQHSVFEIITNAIDEAREGYGKKIIITRYLDHSIEVQDFGRGCPVDYNPKEDRFNWELLYCELYAGSKYDNSETGTYQFSLGTNGLGLCSTQYASKYMDVEIKRDGFKYNLHFEEGENIGGLKKEPYAGKDTGTRTRWLPDNNVFTDTNIPVEFYEDVLKRQAVVNDGLVFVFKNQISASKFETKEFVYKNGILDYINETVGDEAGFIDTLMWKGERKGRDRADKPEYLVKMNMALNFSNKVQKKEYYHNSSYLEYGGAPDKAVRSAFVSQFDAFFKQNNKYNKNESKVSFADIEESLVMVISSFSNQTSYENQTKKAITNKFIQEALTDFIKQNLEVFFIENKPMAEKVGEQILINKRSREKSEKERLNIKKTLQASTDMASRVQKFVDCRSKDTSIRELYIVEGDSAMGSVKQARDPEFQGIMPVRGKILNCLKAEYTQIFKSEIITNLIRVLGCGVEVQTKANKDLSTFDINSFRWNKVVICTDADVDGFHIRTLILTMLYRLTPTLIRDGYVYIAETPLYEIITKDKTYYAYDDKEKGEVLEMIGDKKYTLQRSKGLGENQADMMNLTTMNPATRRLIKVLPEDVERTAEMFDTLIGNNLESRKNFIADKGHEYLEFADIS